MWFSCYLWLLLCYSQYGRGNLLEDYEEITQNMLYPPEDKYSMALPVEIGKDNESGCICRATKSKKTVVCFGNYGCKKFPKLNWPCESFMLRTTVLQDIHVGELDSLYYLKDLRLEANHRLNYIQPGVFRNLTALEHLTISYQPNLSTINEGTFYGLINLNELVLINNGFNNIIEITAALKPNVLPSLKQLDLSKNPLNEIPQNAFKSMNGSKLQKLTMSLCGIDFIHANSFLPLKMLNHFGIGSNELNSSVIINFLQVFISNKINLIYLDISDMGFRKKVPRMLLEVIANTTIKTLILSNNQFEILTNDAFPRMANIEIIDLRKVSALSIGSDSFEPQKFPNLRILLLSGNNLPGIHFKHLSNQQVELLDLSSNKGPPSNPMYYEIDRGAFIKCERIKVLNLAFNRIKSIYDYTFEGLRNLKFLNLENSTISNIGAGTFKNLNNLEILNLANNPLTVHENFTSFMFEGLNNLKVLIFKNCGIKRLSDNDNIFEMMPNLSHLVLKNNQIYYITEKLLRPMKHLRVLDLSENLMVSWWKPLFLTSDVQLQHLDLTNNKIAELTKSMIDDINFLLHKGGNNTVEIDLVNNVFVCDCNSMHKIYLILQGEDADLLRNYITNSNILCSSPDVWEDRTVAEYISSIKHLRCLVYKKISKLMLLIWTAPSLCTVVFFASIIIIIYKYRYYLKYWLFLAKLALGRKLVKILLKSDMVNETVYKYDAFVSYSNEDREFISEMISHLEGTPPFLKLCVYERDFEIGSFISESILASINESKYMILVISENFAKSQWCRWETQLAEYHRLFLEDGTVYDPLVLIKINEIRSKYLTTTLKYLLKSKVYLSWDEKQSEEFWMKLRKVLMKNRRT